MMETSGALPQDVFSDGGNVGCGDAPGVPTIRGPSLRLAARRPAVRLALQPRAQRLRPGGPGLVRASAAAAPQVRHMEKRGCSRSLVPKKCHAAPFSAAAPATTPCSRRYLFLRASAAAQSGGIRHGESEMSDRNDGDVPRTVHDALFKRCFSDPALAAQELRAVLPPALVACVDWSVMTPMPTSFVDAVFHQRTGDLVYQGRFLGGEDVIFWLLEHQSTEDWWMLERVFDTKRMMWRRWHTLKPEARHLPVIVPVVVYNGPRPWRAPRDMHALYGLSEDLRAALGPHVLSCSLIIDDLSVVDDEALRRRRMDAYALLCLFAMGHAAAEDFLDRLAAWQEELRRFFRAGNADHVDAFVRYTYHVHRHTNPRTVRERIVAVVGTEHEDVMLSVAEQLINQGLEKGQRAMLLRQLGRRFGAVPEPIAARVSAATPAELERWSDRVLDAASLDDVFVSE
jgi:hypothetical protein